MNTYLYLSTIFIIFVNGMGFFAVFLPHQFVDFRRVAVYLLVGAAIGLFNSLVCIILRRRSY